MNIKMLLLYVRLGCTVLAIIVFCIMCIVFRVQKSIIADLRTEKAALIQENNNLYNSYELLLNIDRQYQNNIEVAEKQKEFLKDESKKIIDANSEWSNCLLPYELQDLLSSCSAGEIK